MENDTSPHLLNYQVMSTTQSWRIVNDGVMGGLSKSSVSIDSGIIKFSGNVSLENNGGFASLRSAIRDYNFSEYQGIELKVKGDGKIYSISMKSTAYFTGRFYTANFTTVPDQWKIINIPFESFGLYYYGREINSKPEIPLDKIKEISLLIGNKQTGNFQIEIKFMKLY